jgi:hypothetical protein
VEAIKVYIGGTVFLNTVFGGSKDVSSISEVGNDSNGLERNPFPELDVDLSVVFAASVLTDSSVARGEISVEQRVNLRVVSFSESGVYIGATSLVLVASPIWLLISSRVHNSDVANKGWELEVIIGVDW